MNDLEFQIDEPRQKRADACIPLFEMKAEEDKQASLQEGRPIYREVPYVTILVPGDKDQIVRRVRDADKERWPTQWAAFEARQEQVTEGTPLDQWPQLSVSRIAELRALNILTVEALADVADSSLHKLGPGARDLKEKAKRFLSAASGVSSEIEKFKERIEKLEEENARLSGSSNDSSELEHLKKRIKELEEENAALAANQKKKPGRKPKPQESVMHG